MPTSTILVGLGFLIFGLGYIALSQIWKDRLMFLSGLSFLLASIICLITHPLLADAGLYWLAKTLVLCCSSLAVLVLMYRLYRVHNGKNRNKRGI